MADLTDHIDELQRDLLILRDQIRDAFDQAKARAARWEPLPPPRLPDPAARAATQVPNQKGT